MKKGKVIDKTKDNVNVERLNKFNLPIIESVNHLLSLINFSENDEKRFLYSENHNSNIYREIKIKKRTGGFRKIEIPCDKIMDVQTAINDVILSSFKMANSCCGYVKGKSIVSNAKPHVKAKVLLKFDVVDFFPSITLKQVVWQFRYFGYGENVSRYLGYLCVNSSYNLPQGAPTSPMLSNLVCVRLDNRIESFCKKNNLIYSRYADDITISSKNLLSKVTIDYIKRIINTILLDEGFKHNEKKFNVITQSSKMKVTGIVVNDKLSVDKKIIRELDNSIRYISKFGLEGHLTKINYRSEKDYIKHVVGLACFVQMIDKDKGDYYLREFKKIFEISKAGL